MCELSRGSLDQIMCGRNFENPILQLLGYKKLRGAVSDQYRLLVSDGVRMNRFTMLSTELNYLFEDNNFATYAVFKVLNYIVTSMNEERKVLIIMDVEVLKLVEEVQCTIGNPTEVENPPETNKPHSSTAVHHEVMEDTMQPSTSRNINNSFCEDSSVPIKTVSPRKRDAIKARVIDKSPIKEWSRNNKNGTWFSVHLVDNSAKIRCVAFDNDCNKFYNDLEHNKMYLISNYNLKREKQECSKLQNEYQMIFTKDTKIIECCEDASTQSISLAQYDNFGAPLLTFQEATKARLGENLDSTDFFTVVATIDLIRTYIYKACPNCKKKLVDLSSKIFKCVKCDKEYTGFSYGLTLNMDISDPTGSCRVAAFNQIAESILDMSIQTLGELKENDNDAYIEKINEIQLKRYTFVLKGKAEIYKGKTRPNFICKSIVPLNHLTYSKHLIGEINKQLNKLNFN